MIPESKKEFLAKYRELCLQHSMLVYSTALGNFIVLDIENEKIEATIKDLLKNSNESQQ